MVEIAPPRTHRFGCSSTVDAVDAGAAAADNDQNNVNIHNPFSFICTDPAKLIVENHCWFGVERCAQHICDGRPLLPLGKNRISFISSLYGFRKAPFVAFDNGLKKHCFFIHSTPKTRIF